MISQIEPERSFRSIRMMNPIESFACDQHEKFVHVENSFKQYYDSL